MDHSLQIRERCERPFLGYILVPCCSEECCNGQIKKIQTMPSAYTSTPSSSSLAVLPEQNIVSYETFFRRRFNSYAYKDSATRALFPATRRVRLQQPQESSRLKFGLEQLPSTCRGSYLQEQPRWKAELTSKPKRNRTIFTADQLERLEKEFERQQYIVGTERFYLAADLGLNETQVKVWFQNRRIKWRRQNLDS